jgi:hypothetical protein
VNDGTKMHRTLLWGGAGQDGLNDSELQNYVDSTNRVAQLVDAQRVDTILFNHPSLDSTVAKLRQLSIQSNGVNPFLSSPEAVRRDLMFLGRCATSAQSQLRSAVQAK